MNIDIFANQTSVGVNLLFILVYLNQNNDVKRYKAKKYYLPKGIIKDYNVIINGKKIYDQPIDSVIDVVSKFAWVKHLKNEKAKTVPNGFIRYVNESKYKP